MVPIINHWLISKDKYKSKCRKLATELVQFFSTTTTASKDSSCLRVSVLFLLNKVYHVSKNENLA